ncbi:MAG: ribonuclease HII [Arcobacteraceae bacterium]|nr:ribonuclease HII [Arcobacteraceae bacterium]
MNILCGIDEAGRGPLAGPMTVVGVVLTNDIDGLDDSKKLTEKKRELLFDTIKENSVYHIVITTNKQIDKLGLSICISNSIKEIMSNIKASNYLMDGNTTFGIKHLECKIKADQSIKEVSAASILAKVTRDRYMKSIAHLYPLYNFDKHKGYGTKAHIESIKHYGFTDLHRTSYKIKGINL